jgi:hypothetical protein
MGQYGHANLQPNVMTSEPIGVCLRTRLAGSAWEASVAARLGGSSSE